MKRTNVGDKPFVWTFCVPSSAVEAYKEAFPTVTVKAIEGDQFDYKVNLNEKAEYGTICVPRQGDYVEGIEKLYTVSSVGTDHVSLKEETGAIKAGVPYIYKKAAGATEVKVCYAGVGVNEPDNNGCLKSTFTAGETVPEGAYVLQSDNMFHKVGSTSITFAPYRAYLQLPTTVSASAFTLDFNGTTGILNAVETARPADTRLFDLSGRQTDSRKGIVIKNGKKYLFK